jgi:uncharacterized protein with FMN-binding domain
MVRTQEKETITVKKAVISAAALATFISSAALGCGGQAGQSLSQVATDPVDDVEVWATASTTEDAAPGTSTTESGGSSSGGSTGGTYADGTYTGDNVGTRHGDVQVAVVIENGAITDVEFLAYPTGHESDRINAQATPVLTQEAIESQSADVQVVSGATLTSEAFMESLDSALSQAM